MRIRPGELSRRLDNPLGVVLIHGGEPLQSLEAADAVRVWARDAGYGERIVLDAVGDFDWGRLAGEAGSLSLFAERRLIDLRIPGGRVPADGRKALDAWLERPPDETALLISAGKLEAAEQKRPWFKTVERDHLSVQAREIGPGQLGAWITRRMRGHKLEITPEAAELLAERVEGNLLAAAQAAERLALIHSGGVVDTDQIVATVAESARYNVFALADAAVAGDAARTARVLSGLRAEGGEPVLAIWALAREVRALASMAYAIGSGQPVGGVMAQHRIWQTRQPLVRKALQRSDTRGWQALLARCARVDQVVKGQAPGRPWEELLGLAMAIAGRPLDRLAL